MKTRVPIFLQGIHNKGKQSKHFLATMFVTVFLLISSSVLFSSEDVSTLTAQGEEALRRENYEQTLLIGQKIVEMDPRNLEGYRLLLISCAVTGRERGFYEVVEEAKRKGVPELWIDWLVPMILYQAGRAKSASEKLYKYEMKWREVYEKSR